MTDAPGARSTPQQVVLAVTGLAAALALSSLLGLVGDLVGLAFAWAGTLLTAGYAPPGRTATLNWWGALLVGAVALTAGVAIGFAWAPLGGVLAAFGGASVLVGCVLGWP